VRFEQGGTAALFTRHAHYTRKADDPRMKQAVFTLLHEPPASHDINRTTWKMADLVHVLHTQDCAVCSHIVRQITTAAGYKWRKARTVLTSKDPNYAFFSSDEFGPFAIKMKGGLSLMPSGEQRVVPQWQRSKGNLILTAALELGGNQVTHFYSRAKNTGEMIRMMDMLVTKYAHCSRIYLSWDAASWHISKRLAEHIEQHNAGPGVSRLPFVETAALPVGAQFLNVIESVFSGLARAIIHNSDYGSVDHAKVAIDCYFGERNINFQLNPRRAGKKIWGQEREPAVFDPANNCKDPHYR
jgi:DDE superfamily endonuclease